jgi:hypothetical protein
MVNATPFGDFTNWCNEDSIGYMGKKDPMASVRRKNLLSWIELKFDGNKSAAAKKADKPATQFIDMLNNPKRSFGAKIARELEQRFRDIGMEKYYLDTDHEQSQPKAQLPPSRPAGTGPFGLDPKDLEGLTDEQEREIRYWVQGRIRDFKADLPDGTGKKREPGVGGNSE